MRQAITSDGFKRKGSPRASRCGGMSADKLATLVNGLSAEKPVTKGPHHSCNEVESVSSAFPPPDKNATSAEPPPE